MRIGRTIGSITLTEAHPTMRGGLLRLVVPLREEDLDNEDGPSPAIVAWDELAAGMGPTRRIQRGGRSRTTVSTRRQARRRVHFSPD